MKNKAFIVLYMLCLVFVLCGCYDYSEAETLSIVSCAAVDLENDKTKLLVFAFDFADSNENENRRVTFVSEGEDLKSAVENMQKEYGTHLYWSHCETIILGKTLAQKGIYPALDFILNTADARITTNILICSATAKEILEDSEDFGKAIIKVINFDKKLYSCPAYTVFKKISLNERYLLPMIFLSDKGAGLEITRCASFLKDKFEGVAYH